MAKMEASFGSWHQELLERVPTPLSWNDPVIRGVGWPRAVGRKLDETS